MRRFDSLASQELVTIVRVLECLEMALGARKVPAHGFGHLFEPGRDVIRERIEKIGGGVAVLVEIDLVGVRAFKKRKLRGARLEVSDLRFVPEGAGEVLRGPGPSFRGQPIVFSVGLVGMLVGVTTSCAFTPGTDLRSQKWVTPVSMTVLYALRSSCSAFSGP
jgi:hypothetical protein